MGYDKENYKNNHQQNDLFSEPVIDILNNKAITRETTNAEVSQILPSRMKK